MFGLVLQRESTLNVPSNLASLDAALMREASDVLGYTPGTARLSRETNDDTLRTGLHALGIVPFTAASVRKYKAKQERKPWMKAWGIQLLLVLVSIGAIIFAIRHDSILLAIGAILTVIVGIIGSVGTWGILRPADWRWQQRELRSYRDPVPSHVLQTAIMMRKAFPRAAIHVDEFCLVEEVADPFLTVSLGGSTFYVEVWDEPTFEGK